MHTPTVNIWTVNGDGKIVPVNHNEPREKFGDITLDPETDSVYRVVPGRHYNLSWYYLGSMTELGYTL